jgi:hypothetical protein
MTMEPTDRIPPFISEPLRSTQTFASGVHRRGMIAAAYP